MGELERSNFLFALRLLGERNGRFQQVQLRKLERRPGASLLLLASKARCGAARSAYGEFARKLCAALGDPVVQLACVGGCPPGVSESVAVAADHGMRSVCVLPLELPASAVMTEEIEAEIRRAAATFSQVSVALLPPLCAQAGGETAMRNLILELVLRKHCESEP